MAMASSNMLALLLISSLLLSLSAAQITPPKAAPAPAPVPAKPPTPTKPSPSPAPAPVPAKPATLKKPSPAPAPVPAKPPTPKKPSPSPAPAPVPAKPPTPKKPSPSPAPAPVPAKPPTPPKPSPSPAPAPTTKPVKNCCYKYKNIRVCINPARPVGQCQKVCNTTVCCTGARLNGASAAPPPATSSYTPVPVPPSTPGKCCLCYGGIRFCLGPQDRPQSFARCARKVCNKYNICFAKGRCSMWG